MSAPVVEVRPVQGRRAIAWLASPAVTAIAVVVVMVVGLGLRFLWLDGKSLWYDEAASLYFADQSLPTLIDLTITRDTPPPLYYLALHGWLSLFGDGAFAIRALSALASALCLPLIFALGRTLADRTTALAATAILAVSPFQIWYAQEVRMYALLTLVGLASTLALARLVQQPGWTRWFVYVVATALMLWIHYLALFTLAAQALVVVLLGRRAVPGHFRWLWTGVVASALLLVPWAPAFLIQSRTYSRFWIPPANMEALERTLWEFSAMYAPYWRLPIERPGLVAAGFLALAVVGGVALRRHGRLAWLLPVTLALVPLALAFVIGLVRPLFLSRTLILVTPMYALLVGAGLVGLARGVVAPARPALHRTLAALGLVWVLVWSGLALQNLYRNAPKEPWDEAARIVAARAQPGDAIVFHSAPAQLPFDYYFRNQALPVTLHGVPSDIERSTGALEQDIDEAALSRLEAIVADGKPVWLILSHDEYVDPDRRVANLLDSRRPLIASHQLYRIEVRHYAPPD